MIRDNWGTPKAIYEAICEHWNILPVVDVCADATNTRCDSWISKEQDALNTDWMHYCLQPVFWMNPPYSQPTMTWFIEKAIKESEHGATVLFLLPAWPDQSWYHDLIKPYPHTFWRGRVRFDPPEGIKASSPRYGNIHGVIRKNKLDWANLI